MVSLCLRNRLLFSWPSLCLRHVSIVPAVRQELLDLGFSETQAERILSMKCTVHSTSTIKELRVVGLNHKTILRILEEKPEILKTGAKQVRDKVDTLRSLGLGEGSLQNSLSRCPSILAMPRSRLLASAQCLKTRCQFSSQQVQKILNTTPEALTKDPNHLEELFQYAYFRMGGKHGDIISSGIFQKSLKEIRVRHHFLERLGRFIPPNKNLLCPLTNPKIKEVVQLSEEDFLSQVARSSSEEFNIFQKILEREERENAEVMEEDEDNLSTDEEYSENEEESDSDDEDYAESVQGDQSK
ncbi:transcription termination factor 4, mitochondrial isoform X4 [Rana temporaria]|uniref:transcription termination factor 4, mitochondrial isoform X2 n=1 Tax=Rana temporaria TaxID=8407 RepID=UPI001AACDC83|nr:transcription termination factor 4, mitochondrial isoform X2 [Rana temporaria]XP_040204841.1 transcription termination factor 4, mitochondrial isoform X4 [Rana temporaria]